MFMFEDRRDRHGSPDPAETTDRQVSSSLFTLLIARFGAFMNQVRQAQQSIDSARTDIVPNVRRGSPDPAETTDRQVSSSPDARSTDVRRGSPDPAETTDRQVSSSPRPTTLFHAAAVLAIILFANVTFGQPSEDIAPINLVTNQAAVCLEVPRFEATWNQFQRSQLLTRLKQFPPIERLLTGTGAQQWKLVEEHVRRISGKPLSDQLLAVFSESLVVAIYAPEGMPPQGVLIAQARDTVTLNQAIRTWNLLDAQQVSQTRTHRGRSYIRRAKTAKSNEVVYYTVIGRTIALSDQEQRIHEVIESHAKEASADHVPLLHDTDLYRTNRARLPADAAAYLFLNTRLWDRVVGEAIEKSPDARWIQPLFQQVAAVTAALRLNEEVVVDLVTDVTGKPTPDLFKQFVEATQGGGTWPQRIAGDAILAISSRMEIGPLIQGWIATSPDAKTDDFAKGRNLALSLLQGRDLFTEILPIALRDWTVTLNGTDVNNASDAPLNLTGRFSLTSTSSNVAPPTDALDQALQFGMSLLAVSVSNQRGANGPPAFLQTRRSEAGAIRVINGMQPWSHSYRLTPQQLVVSTAESLLTDQRAGETEKRNDRLTKNSRRYFNTASQLVWLDSVRLRQAISQHGEWLANHAASDSASRERLQKHLSKIDEVAKMFDAAFIAAKFDEDHIRISFGAALDRNE